MKRNLTSTAAIRFYGWNLAVAMATLLLAGIFGSHAGAAVFHPACTGPDLIAAIENANGNAEADEINLPASCTVTLAESDNSTDGENGLPSIATDIVINGNGGTIQRDPDSADSFRIFHVADTGVLTLNDVAIRNGATPETTPGVRGGAGIFNRGTLNIENSVIENNHNDFGGGGIYSNGVAVNIANSRISGNTAGRGGGGIRNQGGVLSITDSVISGNESLRAGGGINGDAGTGTINLTRCTIANNTARDPGGGISVNESRETLVVKECTIADNIAKFYGGGISVNDAKEGGVTISDSTISGNQAGLDGDPGGGGGISLNNSGADFVRIENTVISGNTAYRNGGGIYHTSETASVSLTIDRCTISENDSTHFSGGGIYSATFGSSRLTIENSTFSRNRAKKDGGAIHTNSLFAISACTFSGNISGFENAGSGSGAAINFCNSLASGEVINSTFAGNTAGLNGGGVRNPGTADFIHCTFAGNSAPNGSGGAVYNDGGATGFKNSILAASHSGGNCGGAVNNLGGNLSDDATCGFGAGDNAEPGLDPSGLRDNGGATLTIGLAPQSPAIDAAPDCSGLATDQRQMPRPWGPVCDSGAFEARYMLVDVRTGDTSIANGTGSFEFGTTAQASPVLATFMVVNQSGADLTLVEPISVPDGFSVRNSFGTTLLAPGSSTDFTVQLDAGGAGDYSGEISFTDGDGNAFAFSVEGEVAAAAIPTATQSGMVLLLVLLTMATVCKRKGYRAR